MEQTTYPPASINSDERKDNVKIAEEDFKWKTGAQDQEGMKGLILIHLRKISDLSCHEFVPAHYKEKPVKTGDGVVIVREYIEDGRLAYCNAVDFLIAIVYPKSDTQFKQWLANKRKEESTLFTKYLEQNASQDKWIQCKLEFRKETFAEIMIMFERSGFWDEEEIYAE